LLHSKHKVTSIKDSSSDNKEDSAKQIVSGEINNVNPTIIMQNECAACHILFKLIDKMQIRMMGHLILKTF
jgi:hypothetical protein